MSARDTITLLPCPFCGGEARMLGGPQAQEIYSVWCVDISCHVHINGTMDAKVTADMWNRRATSPGFSIIHDSENHKATVERCAEIVTTGNMDSEMRSYSEYFATAIRSLMQEGRADG